RTEYFDFYICGVRTEASFTPAQSLRVGALSHDRGDDLRHHYSSPHRLGDVLQFVCPFKESAVRRTSNALTYATDVLEWNHGVVVRNAGNCDSGRCTCASREFSVSRSAAVHSFLGSTRDPDFAGPDFAPFDGGAPVCW